MEPTRILPRNVFKYTGYISERARVEGSSFLVCIRAGEVRYAKTFHTREEAEAHLKEKNIEFELPIKNIVWEYPDHLEVELTRGKRMICDRTDWDLVEKHTWFAQANGYACTNINSRTILFHNIKLGHVPTNVSTVDHINRDSLDNRASNLWVTDRRTQNINRNLLSNNTSGHRGVRRTAKGLWEAIWQDADGNNLKKSFSVKKYGEDEAKRLTIAHRQLMETTLPHYILALQN